MESIHWNGSSNDLRIHHSVTSSGEGEHSNSRKELGVSASSSSSGSDSSSSRDNFQLYSNASSKALVGASATEPPKLDEDQYQGHFQHEFHHNDFGTQKLSRSSSSSSSSASDTSDEEDPFQLLTDTTSKANHVGATVPQKVDEDHHRVLLEPEMNHTLSVMELGNSRIPNNDSRTHHVNAFGETHVPTAGKKLGHSSSSSSSASDTSTEEGHKSITNSDLGTHDAKILWADHSSTKGEKLFPSSLPENEASKKPEGTVSDNKPDKDHDQGLLKLESHQTLPEVEQVHKSVNTNDLRTYPVAVYGEAASVPVEKLGSSLPSSSPASESSSKDSSQLAVKARSNSPTRTVQFKDEMDSRSASDSSIDEIPISSMPNNEQSSSGVGHLSPTASPDKNGDLGSSNDSVTQYPPVRVIERPGDPASSSSYRIPSHVFARNKSTTPMEWSVTSNESLFSIHTGNMSFSRDQQYLTDFSNSPPPPVNKSTELSQTTAKPDKDSGVAEAKANEAKAAEAKAAETMREIIRENAENDLKENTKQVEKTSVPSPLISQHSDGSTKSFAFPILTGDAEKTASPKVAEEKPRQLVQSQPQIPKETPDPNAAQTPKSTTNSKHTQNKSWFSCFCCCPFCS